MGIIVWVLRAAWSLVWLLVKWIFRFSARSTKKAIQASQGFVLEQTKEYERKSAPITSENWYDKASMICGETVDALMNEKTGTSERIVRSLAAKLGFSGAAAGLFSIASVFGTASTGTAISTLSGAAFNSAALKWIGGGVSMAVGGWVVFLISFVVGVLSYVAAILTFRKFKGTKRKLKNLDSQEKRVVETLMLISIGFRAQAGLPLGSGPPDLLARRFQGSSVHAATSP